MPGLIENEYELCVFPEESDNCMLINSNETDPDQNYFTNVQWDSPYTTLESWQDKIDIIESNFTVLHINCRSVFYKLDEICNFLKYLPVSVLTISESWLLPEEEDSMHVPGYTFIHKSRGNDRGGGIGMFIKKPIKFLLTNAQEASASFEQLFAKIFLADSTYLVGVIYRPPGKSLPDFNNEFENLLNNSIKKGQEAIITGDFNIDLLKINDHKETNRFYSCLTSHQLFPAITR